MLWYICGMAATPSTMLPLGTAAPPFALPDVVSGETISLETFADNKALLVMFLCRHCKYMQHVKQALATLGQEYQGTDLGIVAISANDATAYAEDAPASLKAMAAAESFTFPFATTRPQLWPKPILLCAPPTFSCSIASATWSIVDNSTGVGQAIRFRRQEKNCGQPSRPSWQISPSIQPRSPVWAVTLNGKRAMNLRISSVSSCGLLCVV
jgi:AhpC/TSA family